MVDAATIKTLERRAAALRRHILAPASTYFAHLGGAMSCADIMAALFFHVLRLEDGTTKRDRFLMSKGHAVTALHACLVELGQIDAAELPLSGQSGSRLAGHPTKKAPGVEFATGSLGHALSVGLGIALAFDAISLCLRGNTISVRLPCDPCGFKLGIGAFGFSPRPSIRFHPQVGFSLHSQA